MTWYTHICIPCTNIGKPHDTYSRRVKLSIMTQQVVTPETRISDYFSSEFLIYGDNTVFIMVLLFMYVLPIFKMKNVGVYTLDNSEVCKK